MAKTVLVIGATGNVGVSVTTAAVRTDRKVLAIVRNQSSQEKMFKHLVNVSGAREAITAMEADVTCQHGVQSVVNQVKAGKLPSFQHVYQTVAYRAVMPYLLEHGGSQATFTMITGAAGDSGIPAATATTQGALFTMASVAAMDNEKTSVRCNEVYLAFRVDYDSVWEEREGGHGMSFVKTSDFAKSHEDIQSRTDVKGRRQVLMSLDDLKVFRYERKLLDWQH